MAAWVDQDVNTLLPGEPWTSAKALAAFENPEAIAEGAANAPKVVGAALNIYGGSIELTNTMSAAQTIPARTKTIRFDYANGAGSRFQIEFSTDGGGTWGAVQEITPDVIGIVVAYLDIPAATYVAMNSAGGRNAAAMTITSTANAMRFRLVTGTGQIAWVFIGGVSP